MVWPAGRACASTGCAAMVRARTAAMAAPRRRRAPARAGCAARSRSVWWTRAASARSGRASADRPGPATKTVGACSWREGRRAAARIAPPGRGRAPKRARVSALRPSASRTAARSPGRTARRTDAERAPVCRSVERRASVSGGSSAMGTVGARRPRCRLPIWAVPAAPRRRGEGLARARGSRASRSSSRREGAVADDRPASGADDVRSVGVGR